MLVLLVPRKVNGDNMITTTKKQKVTLEESKGVAASKSSIKYAVGILKTRKDVDQIKIKDVLKCAILSVVN